MIPLGHRARYHNKSSTQHLQHPAPRQFSNYLPHRHRIASLVRSTSRQHKKHVGGVELDATGPESILRGDKRFWDILGQGLVFAGVMAFRIEVWRVGDWR